MNFNKNQRVGLYVLIFLIITLQIIIIKVDFPKTIIENSEQIQLAYYYNQKLDSLKSIQKNKSNQKQYFKFNPNKLRYNSWSYLGLSSQQLYKLDSFRVNNEFTSNTQVQDILKLNDSIFSRIDSLMYFPDKYIQKQKYQNVAAIKYTSFNPNTYKKEDWVKIGFSENQSEVIVNYAIKKGGFKFKEELKEIYVINEKKYSEIEAFIDIPIPAKEKIISLNTASIDDFKKVKGIGEVYSKVIVDYRENLGGFKYHYQLKEIKFIDSLIFDNLKTTFPLDKDFTVRTININKATLEELEKHPYISWRLANAIVEFRTNFRSFNTLDELKNIEDISDSYFNKIKLYLTLG